MKFIKPMSLLVLVALQGVTVTAASSTSSNATLGLKANEQITVPVNPNDPSKPGDPGDGNITNNKGPLSLDVAPKNFEFGKQLMYKKKHSYKANPSSTTSDGKNIIQFLQVTDNRDAGIYGWKVQVKQDKYLTNQSGYELTGTTLHIPKGTSRNSINDVPSNKDNNYIESDVDITTSDITIWGTSSEKDMGKATSTYVWNAENVSLTIPKNTAKPGVYSNNIVWSLVSTVAY